MRIIILLLLFFMLVIPAYGLPTGQTITITSEVGETYVQWGFSGITDPMDVYLDGSPVAVHYNFTSSSLLQGDLEAGSRHNIDLYSSASRIEGSTVVLGRGTAVTSNPVYVPCFLMFLVFLLTVILIFFEVDLIVHILFTLLTIGIAIFSVFLSQNHGMFPYIFIGFAVIVGIIFLIKDIPKIIDELSWW